ESWPRKTEDIAHRIEAGLSAPRPEGRRNRATRENVARPGAMAEDDLLSRPRKDDRVITDDRAAAQCRETDRTFRTGARMSVPHPDRIPGKVDLPAAGDGLSQQQCRARRRIDL